MSQIEMAMALSTQFTNSAGHAATLQNTKNYLTFVSEYVYAGIVSWGWFRQFVRYS